MSLIFEALENFSSEMTDVDFTTLITLFDQVASGSLHYSPETT